MILAAAAYGNDVDKQPPPELRLALQCRSWGCLPKGGGALDQPAGLLRKMGTLVNVYEACRAFHRAKSWALFEKENPELWDTVQWVMEVEKVANGGNQT